uniref:Uncharacterized protein n=1 Tax=Candidatus Kentrum sp. UNK TaxID=2126344 RepID=A0A451A732_9GAMM|nr:MAG: hypothetical protein BECKUNK1418G_GA0071005_101928 [Candidatus Kentron sp. UNK]VFK70013.1 MAG: hypothetical protein BECKUNK1418H_GA0071006_102228 [Candidatus Kentron sp. UNK]
MIKRKNSNLLLVLIFKGIGKIKILSKPSAYTKVYLLSVLARSANMFFPVHFHK